MTSRRDAGFTMIELLIVMAIIAIVAAIAAGGLLRSRAAANEVGAIASVRVTFSSQKAYAATCGRGAYATSYPVLGTGIGSGPAFISADLGSVASPTKAGYRFTMAPGAGSAAGPPDCLGRATMTAFYVAAAPMSVWQGSRSFAVTANGTLWQISGATPPAEPFGPPASPIQ
jgi:prepilin-type N-terminal cleavage/methylation domain-containing protein